MVKIHFKGYSEKFDEWRPWNKNNMPLIRLELSDDERVYREIKRKLYSGGRDDPVVRTEIQVDEAVFDESLGTDYVQKISAE